MFVCFQRKPKTELVKKNTLRTPMLARIDQEGKELVQICMISEEHPIQTDKKHTLRTPTLEHRFCKFV